MGKIKRDGYTFYSFLQSDGNAYIDTNYHATADCTFTLDFTSTNNSGNFCFFGAGNGNSYNNGEYSIWYYGERIETCIPLSQQKSDVASINNIYKTNTDYKLILSSSNCILNKRVLYSFTVYPQYYCNRTLTLFAEHRASIIGISNIKVKRFEVKIGGTKVIDYIPASRDSDGVCGMYDLVTDTFLTNANTVGTFTVGEEKDYYEWVDIKEIKRLKTPRLPKEFQEVEYIESTGTQWIDTGIVPNLEDCEVWADYELYATSLFGSQDTSFLVYRNEFYKNNAIEFRNIPFFTNKSLHIKLKDGHIRIDLSDGSVYEKDTSAYPNPHTIPIFANWVGYRNAYTDFGKGRIVRFKINNADATVCDIIPCYRKSDGVIGMYDIVNDTFHTNQGTGTFLKGADVKFETIRTINRVINGELKTVKLRLVG